MRPTSATQPPFLSTLPARGATTDAEAGVHLVGISIHAPREGSDLPARQGPPAGVYFYPRSPRGERRATPDDVRQQLFVFLSTLPARGATCKNTHRVYLLREFLSTLPARGATRGGLRPGLL